MSLPPIDMRLAPTAGRGAPHPKRQQAGDKPPFHALLERSGPPAAPQGQAPRAVAQDASRPPRAGGAREALAPAPGTAHDNRPQPREELTVDAAPHLPSDHRLARAIAAAPSPVAHVFNAFGFFHGVAASGAQAPHVLPPNVEAPLPSPSPADLGLTPNAHSPGGAHGVATPASDAVRAAEPAPASRSPADLVTRPGPVAFDTGLGAPAAGTAMFHNRTMVRAARLAATPAAGAAPKAPAVRHRPEAAEGGGASPRAKLAALVEDHLRRSGASAVRVDLHALEDGLIVLAHADGLDGDERTRLATEIEAMLARHGRTAARIGIDGLPTSIRRL